MEFSKIIVWWAIFIATACFFGFSVGYYKYGSVPVELINLVGTIVTGVIISYCAKAGVENSFKITKGENKDENI